MDITVQYRLENGSGLPLPSLEVRLDGVRPTRTIRALLHVAPPDDMSTHAARLFPCADPATDTSLAVFREEQEGDLCTISVVADGEPAMVLLVKAYLLEYRLQIANLLRDSLQAFQRDEASARTITLVLDSGDHARLAFELMVACNGCMCIHERDFESLRLMPTPRTKTG